MFNFRSISTIAVFLAPFFIGGFAFPSVKKQQSIALVIPQQLTVCSYAGFPPFEMLDEKGTWSGFDIDLMQAFAQELNVKLVMVNSTMDGLIPSLLTKKCDLIASGFTITSDRSKVVSFSNPVIHIKTSLAALDNPKNRIRFKEFNDFKQPQVRVAVHIGTAAYLYLKNNHKNIKPLVFNDINEVVNAVSQGKADAFIEDDIFIIELNKSLKNKFLMFRSDILSPIAMAFTRQNLELRISFDRFLKHLEETGELKKITKKWF
ncbi:MAG: ABC transporter substrate-binding protein [Silvanigrellaceae bacterium]|nr:ABC transporter substrate-binding protein [Silvanigrellaceae bacterium]